MKEKNIKFIMELIFIFILPLLFILPKVSINNNYVYDNDGNFETSSKEITYDSIDYNDSLGFEHKDFSSSFVGEMWIPINDNNYGILDGNDLYILNNSNVIYLILSIPNNRLIYNNNGDYQYFDKVGEYNYNGIIYYKFIISIDIVINLETDNFYYNYGYYESYIIYSPFHNIKFLISGILLIDSSDTTFNIIVDYTCFWFIMFVIWHLFYCLIDFIIHLIRIKRKE